MSLVTRRIDVDVPTPTIRVLVPLDRLAEVLRVIATEVALDEEAKVKVQDPTRRPVKHDLPVRGLDSASPTARWKILLGLALGAGVGLSVTLAIPALRGVPSLLLLGATVLLGVLIGAVAARPVAPARWLELGDPDRVRIVRIRGLRGYQDGMERLRAAGLAVIDRGEDDILLADLRRETGVNEPELPRQPRIEL